MIDFSGTLHAQSQGELRKLAPEFLVERDTVVQAVLQSLALGVAGKDDRANVRSAGSCPDEVDEAGGLVPDELASGELRRVERDEDDVVTAFGLCFGLAAWAA